MLKEVDLLRQKVRDFDGRIGAGAANNLKWIFFLKKTQNIPNAKRFHSYSDNIFVKNLTIYSL